MKINEVKNGSVLEIYVKPNSREFKITVENGEIVVFCKEEPQKGKANKEIIKEFSRIFRKKVSVVSGFTSRQKRLMIEGVGKIDIERVLLSR